VAIDSRNQLVRRHRHGEVRVSTGLPGPLFVLGTAPGLDDEERNIRRFGAIAQLPNGNVVISQRDLS
jgi:hypothetical protein